MKRERQKMLAGELYDPMDRELVAAWERARDLCQVLNATREGEQEERQCLLCELFGASGSRRWRVPGRYGWMGRGATISSSSRCRTGPPPVRSCLATARGWCSLLAVSYMMPLDADAGSL